MNAKYYIKCSNCSQLVELKSEYMVLCPSCGHKLSNSFSVWRAENPDGDFKRYISEVCVSSAAVSGLSDQKRITRSIKRRKVIKRLSILGGSAVVLFVIIASVMWFTRSMNDSSIDKIINSGWKLNYYEDLRATVQFPFVLEATVDTTFTVPDTTTMVKRVVARQWSKPMVCNITAMRMEYEGDATANRETATSQILQSLVSDNQMQAFQFIPSDYMLGDTKARMLAGSYLIETTLYEFRAVMIIKWEELWYFMVAYPASNPEGTMLAEKFFRTIQLQ